MYANNKLHSRRLYAPDPRTVWELDDIVRLGREELGRKLTSNIVIRRAVTLFREYLLKLIAEGEFDQEIKEFRKVAKGRPKPTVKQEHASHRKVKKPERRMYDSSRAIQESHARSLD